jgi:hypothetical protein
MLDELRMQWFFQEAQHVCREDLDAGDAVVVPHTKDPEVMVTEELLSTLDGGELFQRNELPVWEP